MTPASDESRLYKHGGLVGLFGMIAMIASLPLAPPWPPASASTDAVVMYFTEHHDGFLRQAWIAGGGVILLLPFAAAIAAIARVRDRAVAGNTVLGAMVVFAAAFGLNWTPWIVIALRPGRSPEITQALYDLGLVGQFVGVGMPLAVLFGAVAVLARDGVVLPKWLGVLAALCVPLNVALAACTALSGPFSPSGPIGFASIGLFTVFGVGASIAMIRRGRSAPAGALAGA